MNINKKNSYLIFIPLIALAAIFIYLPTLKSGFLWDDIQIITHPLHIGNNPYAFFFGGDVYYRPLIHLSMNLDYSLWHLDPLGFHVTNILLHAINSILVFLAAFYLIESRITASETGISGKNRLLQSTWTPFLAALFFALHPIHTESVAWISGRSDMIATLFFLLAFLAYLTYERDGHAIGLFLSSFFFSAHYSAKRTQ